MVTFSSMGYLPVWVRVTLLVVLILVGIAISPLLLDAAGVDGGHGSTDVVGTEDGGHGQEDGSPSGGGHDGGDHGSRQRDRSGSDH